MMSRWLKMADTQIKYNNKKGFTIVELLVALALLAIILSGVYTLYFYIQSSFNRTDSQSRINQDMNLIFMQMERDIRSASKPHPDIDSVVIRSRQEIHIFTYDDDMAKYLEIVYRLDPSDLTALQRGWAACADAKPPAPAASKAYGYGEITNWETLMKGIIEEYGGKYTGFEYSAVLTPTGKPTPTPSIRKTILVTLIANDTAKPLENPIVSARLLTSRSKSIP